MRKVVGSPLVAFATLVAGVALGASSVGAGLNPAPQTEIDVGAAIPHVVGDTTVATTAPATTGTAASELPTTGSSNLVATLLAGLLVLGGIGAVITSRRS